MTAFTDEDLVRKARESGAGEGRAFLDELFQRHYRQVALWCYRITGDRDSAADLAQDIFAKAYQHIASFRGDSKFTSWLYAVVRNHCMTSLREHRRRANIARQSPFEEAEAATVNPLEQLERNSLSLALRNVMKQCLTEVEQRVMILHYAQELPLGAISRLLQLTNASGAKAYIVSGRRNLMSAVNQTKNSAVVRRR